MDCKRAQSMVTPYILKKLNDKELEEFLEHISTCRECYEELEIYFTVHYTLARLDDEEGGQVYDVENALQNNLEESRFYVWKTRVARIYRLGIMMLAELFLLVILLSQAELWQTGSMESNPICQFIRGDSQKDTEAEIKTEETKAEAESEKETQPKKADEDMDADEGQVKEPANAPETENPVNKGERKE